MKKIVCLFALIASLLVTQNVCAVTFKELMENNCNVSAAQLEEGQLMLKTGLCMGYFSALTDLLRARGVACGTEGYPVGAMVDLANQALTKNPELGRESAHTGVMAVVSANFLCSK